LDAFALSDPAADLSFQIARRSSNSGIDEWLPRRCVNLAKYACEVEPDRASLIGPRRPVKKIRQRIANHDSRRSLHYIERCADHRVVITCAEHLGDRDVRSNQFHDSGLANNIVCRRQ
jgi:hypothetical protein